MGQQLMFVKTRINGITKMKFHPDFEKQRQETVRMPMDPTVGPEDIPILVTAHERADELNWLG